jgi:hypothetical protein
MTHRRTALTIVGTGLAGITAAGAVLLPTTANADRHDQTIRFVDTTTQAVEFDNSVALTGIDTERRGHGGGHGDRARPHGDEVGTSSVLVSRAHGGVRIDGSVALEDGTINFARIRVDHGDREGRGVVTGGTGEYRGADGTIRTRELDEESTLVRIRLTD